MNNSMEKHLYHIISMDTTPIEIDAFSPIYGKYLITHAGRMICLECDIQLKWASKREVIIWNEMGVDNTTLELFERYKRICAIPDPDYIYLKVSFDQKEGAKRMGALWDPYMKSWYAEKDHPNLPALTNRYEIRDY